MRPANPGWLKRLGYYRAWTSTSTYGAPRIPGLRSLPSLPRWAGSAYPIRCGQAKSRVETEWTCNLDSPLSSFQLTRRLQASRPRPYIPLQPTKGASWCTTLKLNMHCGLLLYVTPRSSPPTILGRRPCHFRRAEHFALRISKNGYQIKAAG